MRGLLDIAVLWEMPCGRPHPSLSPADRARGPEGSAAVCRALPRVGSTAAGCAPQTLDRKSSCLSTDLHVHSRSSRWCSAGSFAPATSGPRIADGGVPPADGSVDATPAAAPDAGPPTAAAAAARPRDARVAELRRARARKPAAAAQRLGGHARPRAAGGAAPHGGRAALARPGGVRHAAQRRGQGVPDLLSRLRRGARPGPRDLGRRRAGQRRLQHPRPGLRRSALPARRDGARGGRHCPAPTIRARATSRSPGRCASSSATTSPGSPPRPGRAASARRRCFLAYRPPPAERRDVRRRRDVLDRRLRPVARRDSAPRRSAQVVHAARRRHQPRGCWPRRTRGRFASAGVLRLADIESGAVDRFAHLRRRRRAAPPRARQLVGERPAPRRGRRRCVARRPSWCCRIAAPAPELHRLPVVEPNGDSQQQVNDALVLGAHRLVPAARAPVLRRRTRSRSGSSRAPTGSSSRSTGWPTADDRVTATEVDARVRAHDVAGYLDLALHPAPAPDAARRRARRRARRTSRRTSAPARPDRRAPRRGRTSARRRPSTCGCGRGLLGARQLRRGLSLAAGAQPRRRRDDAVHQRTSGRARPALRAARRWSRRRWPAS